MFVINKQSASKLWGINDLHTLLAIGVIRL